MKRIGITGQSGFIGSHLARYVEDSADLELIPFSDSFFLDDNMLSSFVEKCDVLVHLAGMSRSENDQELYDTNIRLVQQVINAMEEKKVTPLVMFSSSTHENRNTAYGRGKLEGRKMFVDWAKRNNASFIGFIFPNIYGPGAKVHYASFVANFAWEISHGVEPKVIVDSLLPLKYVGNLCEFIGAHMDFVGIAKKLVPMDFEMKVTDVLAIFKLFVNITEEKMCESIQLNNNIYNLYKTFMSYKRY